MEADHQKQHQAAGRVAGRWLLTFRLEAPTAQHMTRLQIHRDMTEGRNTIGQRQPTELAAVVVVQVPQEEMLRIQLQETEVPGLRTRSLGHL